MLVLEKELLCNLFRHSCSCSMIFRSFCSNWSLLESLCVVSDASRRCNLSNPERNWLIRVWVCSTVLSLLLVVVELVSLSLSSGNCSSWNSLKSRSSPAMISRSSIICENVGVKGVPVDFWLPCREWSNKKTRDMLLFRIFSSFELNIFIILWKQQQMVNKKTHSGRCFVCRLCWIA